MRYMLVALVAMITLECSGKETISGYVRDAASGEALVGANVIIKEFGTGTITNEYGYYALSLEPGNYTIIFSYVGYASVTRNVSLGEGMVLNIELSELLHELEEVTVTSQRVDSNISKVETGSTRLAIQSIRSGKYPPCWERSM